MDRKVRPLGDHLAPRVEHAAGIVAGRFQNRRIGRLGKDDPHLLGNLVETVLDDFEGGGIGLEQRVLHGVGLSVLYAGSAVRNPRHSSLPASRAAPEWWTPATRSLPGRSPSNLQACARGRKWWPPPRPCSETRPGACSWSDRCLAAAVLPRIVSGGMIADGGQPGADELHWLAPVVVTVGVCDVARGRPRRLPECARDRVRRREREP